MRQCQIENQGFSWKTQYLSSTKPTFHLLIIWNKNLVYFSKYFLCLLQLQLQIEGVESSLDFVPFFQKLPQTPERCNILAKKTIAIDLIDIIKKLNRIYFP